MKLESTVTKDIIYVRLQGDLIGSPDSQQLIELVNNSINETKLLRDNKQFTNLFGWIYQNHFAPAVTKLG